MFIFNPLSCLRLLNTRSDIFFPENIKKFVPTVNIFFQYQCQCMREILISLNDT